MTVERHLALYDGQRFLGSIIGCDEQFVARDVAGDPLGVFATVKQASDAISKVSDVCAAAGDLP